MEEQQIIYEIVCLVADVCLEDTRAPLYRTKTGKIRPTLSMCFAPGPNLVMAYSLNAEPLNKQTLAALLYAAFTTSEKIPYGGLPDIITCGSIEAFTPALQQTLEHWGILVQPQSGPISRRSVERFLAKLQREFWDELLDGFTPDNLPSDARTVDFTLFEIDHLLQSYLLAHNQAICGELEESSHVAWQPSRRGESSQLRMLLGPDLTRTLTRKGISYLMQTYWHERLALFAPGTTVLLRPISSFSTSIPETLDVFVRSEWICSLAVQQERWSREIALQRVLRRKHA